MTTRMTKLSKLYRIDSSIIEDVYKLAKKHDIHIYDAYTAYLRYDAPSVIDKHCADFSFNQKIVSWYKSDRYLVNTEKYREAAETFRTTGSYTNLKPNKHPNSEYMKFWVEEARRSIYGFHIGNDWISGYYYFYLNYSPIDLAVVLDDTSSNGAIRGDRITDFASMWDGDYYYFHYLEECERTGKQAAVLKARGRGFSWKHASMLDRNFFLIPKSKSMVYASSKEYLTGNDGILTKAWSIMSHLDLNTAWAKRRQVKNTQDSKRASLERVKNGVKTETGFMSEISGITLGDSVHKLRGKRSKLIIFEESGSFKDLETAWIVSDPSVKQGNIVFGLKVAFGTGGEEGSQFEGLKNLFYKPDAFNVLSLPNVWSGNAEHNKVGWFAPSYINLEGHYDKDGNSNIEVGKKAIEQEREDALVSGVAPSTFQKMKAENPLVPEDAILRSTLSPFPVQMLSEHLVLLETDTAYRGKVSKGTLSLTMENEVVWQEDLLNKVHVIGTDDVNSLNVDGGIEVYQHPPSMKVSRNTFIIGVDPIDFDRNEVGKNFSLGSMFVMNTLTEQIVAEYTGRPANANDFYENVRRLSMYYNAKVMYENNLKGLYVYFTNKFSEHMLSLKPTILQDTNEQMKVGNRKYGFTAAGNQSSSILKYGRQLIKEWLEKRLSGTDDTRLLYTIRSAGLVRELIDWHADGNYDRVSALIAVMIHLADTDRTRTRNGSKSTEVDVEARNFYNRPFLGW